MSKPDKSPVEFVKENSDGLRGAIVGELATSVEYVGKDAARLLKFHGTYQQDNRDTRKVRRRAGLDKEYIFMVRNRIPGGKITAEQSLGELDLADEFGNGTLRITTRQGIQLHGVIKANLWQTIRRINEIKLSTQSACGDVERNVVCCPAPLRHDGLRDQLQQLADQIAEHLRPRTRAYHEIWIQDPETGDKQRVVGPPRATESEPIYGTAYLPRKFKTGIALCDDNCIDVYDQDAGLLAVTKNGSLLGFNLLVGGSMGTTPSDDRCFPALAKRMAFITPGQVLPVLTAVVLAQRDFGDRTDRKQARLKYLIHNWGVPRFKAQVEAYLGEAERLCGFAVGAVPRILADPDPADVTRFEDHLGWHEQGDGSLFLGLPIENGRIKDEGSLRLKSALRVLFGGICRRARLTAQQNLLLCDLDPSSRPRIERILSEHGVATVERLSTVRRFAFACPALPTCGLAVTESERMMPTLISELEAELSRLGLSEARFSTHITGCPNGCARPYNCDLGIVGRSVDGKTGEGKYTLFVGGNQLGSRMNEVYRDLVPASRIVTELRPLLLFYRQGRSEGESFGDFCARMGTAKLGAYVAATAAESPGEVRKCAS